MNISQAVAFRIAELLKEKNLTQYKLGQLACLSHDTIKSIMKGKAKGVNLKTIIAVADGFNMTASEFLNSPLFEYNNLNMD
ncbi:MAG: helix-turn-helix transcriptional regulator [Clostridia bacterium]|nr:helix-turn-helix transcriptional regulator [Clostridia bacterium]